MKNPFLPLNPAIEQELAHISEVPYNSHEICKHFAAFVSKAFADKMAELDPVYFEDSQK